MTDSVTVSAAGREWCPKCGDVHDGDCYPVRPTCKTPGAEWYLRAGDRGVCVEVEFPMSVDFTRGEAGRLNVAMHEAIEAILAPYFLRSVDV